ncbi:MAG: hypothetical protein ACNS64_06430, partial [Candidatus Halalkalibacterium sp. M3_1C_030]
FGRGLALGMHLEPTSNIHPPSSNIYSLRSFSVVDQLPASCILNLASCNLYPVTCLRVFLTREIIFK